VEISNYPRSCKSCDAFAHYATVLNSSHKDGKARKSRTKSEDLPEQQILDTFGGKVKV